MVEAEKNLMACHGCGHVQHIPDDERRVNCERCERLLYVRHPGWLDHAGASVLTAVIFFVVTISFPFVTLEAAGMQQEMSIISGIWALVERDEWLLAAIVFVTIVLMPLLEIIALLYVVVPFRLQRRLPYQIPVFRWLVIAQPWSMLEIFALAVLVTLVKVGEEAVLVPEVGMYGFFGLVGALFGAYLSLDKRLVWAWLKSHNYFADSSDTSVVSCRVCDALIGRERLQRERLCGRCGAHVYERIPKSFQKTAALVLAAAILYIPANFLPMMSYTYLGTTRTDTIFSGVVSLISDGLWWVAVIVFVASILVPIAKLVVLTYLLWLVKTGITAEAGTDIERQHNLYRMIEVVGRWSMVDVFVVTLLVALVQFGLFGYVEPRGAIVAFGGVVVLTMLATQTFDPRLLWDAQQTAKATSEIEHPASPSKTD
jgi:paraquat-inducible protein A